MKSFEGRVAIVTGSSRGIGKAVAFRLASDGASVVVNYRHGEKEAGRVVETIMGHGGRAAAVQADLGLAGGAAVVFDAAEKKFGKVNILVNNAGIALPGHEPIADVSDEQFDSVFAVNCRGVFTMLRQAARRMPDGGRIVNLSSTLTAMALPGYSVYAATKAAVEMFTRVMAKELAGRNITVNAVAPGPVDTELFNRGKTEEVKRRMAEMAPLKRLGRPEDIAGVVAFLAGNDGGWINGQVVMANGGMA